MRVISSNITRMHWRLRIGTSTPQQPFDRHAVGMLVHHHGHVVQTIHVGHGLQEGPGLGKLFRTAMQQADVRVGALDDLAVELQHQTQHAVRGGMLRAKVQRVVTDLGHAQQHLISKALRRPDAGAA